MRNEADIVCCNCIPWIGYITLIMELLMELLMKLMNNLIDEILNKDIKVE